MAISIEKNLRRRVLKARRLEMEKYGRTKIYDQIFLFLPKSRRVAFSLVNHALAMIDDEIDAAGSCQKRISRAIAVLRQGFCGQSSALPSARGKDILRLGRILSELRRTDFGHAAKIFEEIINYWEIERQNLGRRNKILKARDLDQLNLKIGRSVSLQFLYFLCPGLDAKVRDSVASSYGLAIKLADNLSDLREDLERGYVNVSEENIKRYGLEISDSRAGDWRSYEKAEFEKIKRRYQAGDQRVEKILKSHPSQRPGIMLFKGVAHSWLRQAAETCFINDLRRFDINNYPQPKFLSDRELLRAEKFWGIRLSDIISSSYEQEVRNTYAVRKKKRVYNPYLHKKTVSVDKKIKEMIGKCSGIKDVFDLGCDDGFRTKRLFRGKKLYGVELVAESVKEAKKRGIQIYQGSMTGDFCKDINCLSKKKFDLVSVLGEMVNFVGLDTSALLENAVRQTKDRGYLLISCMHSEFDRTQNGKYVVWSFTDYTKGEWALKETKIPRVFLVISKGRLLKVLNDIAYFQNCCLTLRDKKEVKNYYRDMWLEINIFQKNKADKILSK